MGRNGNTHKKSPSAKSLLGREAKAEARADDGDDGDDGDGDGGDVDDDDDDDDVQASRMLRRMSENTMRRNMVWKRMWSS